MTPVKNGKSANGKPTIGNMADDPALQTARRRLESLRQQLAEVERGLVAHEPAEDRQARLEADARALLEGGTIPDHSAQAAARRAREETRRQAQAQLPVVRRALEIQQAEVQLAEEQAAERATQNIPPWLKAKAAQVVRALQDLHQLVQEFNGDLEWLAGALPTLDRGSGPHGYQWRPLSVPGAIDAKLFTELRNYAHNQLAPLVGLVEFSATKE